MPGTSLKLFFANCDAVNHVPANFIRPRMPPVMAATGAKLLLADLLQVKNHGVPEEVVEKIVNVGREFFNLPESEKLKNYSDDPLKTTRLSTTFNVKTEKVSNWKDFLRLHCHPLEDYIQERPTNPPSFRKTSRQFYDVFINHRGIDTKRNFAGLLFDNLTRMRIRTFFDRMSMKPGDRLLDDIDKAILGCKVGAAVFSPRYCESYSCLHELALLIESKKRLVPIFYDVQPSQLQVRDNGTWPAKELQRFSLALEKARNTVGLTFDSSTGDWSELLRNASDAVIINLVEAEKEPKHQ